jgi:hypothetical protein
MVGGLHCFLLTFNEICTTIFELKKNDLIIDAVMVKLTRSTWSLLTLVSKVCNLSKGFVPKLFQGDSIPRFSSKGFIDCVSLHSNKLIVGVLFL